MRCYNLVMFTMTRQLRKAVSWLACAAVLLSALMPSLSHALAPKRLSPFLVEICSASGSKAMSAMQSSFDADADSGSVPGHGEDCSYCRVQSDMPVLPIVAHVIEQTSSTAPFPTLFYRSPSPLFQWVASNPRAPPVLA